MRIPCPFCGDRDSSEFYYLGDANTRGVVPEPQDMAASIVESMYLRDNPAGLHAEHWYHSFGCRRWLKVERDTRSHEIFSAIFTRIPQP